MSFKHFTKDDRIKLSVLLRAKVERKEIGRILNKDATSIWREINRNSIQGKYLPSVAKRESQKRKTHRKKKIENDEWLKKYILKKLKLYWSPEQIAGRLRRKNIVIIPREKAREYGKKRWIGERPAVINQRARIGDLEGDTIVGKTKTKRILTHVERMTGYLVADFLPLVSAEIVAQKTIESLKKFPKQKRKSITYDNGTEFSAHEIIERKTKATVYFANAYHSWERGTNENTNGLIRQFFPKKSFFAKVTQVEVSRVAKLLNRRPRKRLNYLTPFETFHCTSI